MKLGIALSGGGVRGAAHIGVLKALQEEGIKPQFISGASSGSIVASLYSIGYTPDEMEELFTYIHKNLIDYDFSIVSKLVKGIMLGKHVRFDGLVRGDKLEKLVERLAQSKGRPNMTNTIIPLAISAVDINSAELIMFMSKKIQTSGMICNTKAKISEAVRASISFPGIFKPKLYEGRRLVDGGVRDNIPVKVLKEMGADKIIAVNLGYCGEHEEDIDNIIEISTQTIDIMAYTIFKNSAEEVDYLIKPEIHNVHLLEIHKIPECIKRGYDVTKKALPDIKAKLKNESFSH